MNPDREMQAEAMDEAQDEILRLTEALAVEKGAHVETAKALVACKRALGSFKWLAINRHNITEDTARFIEFFDAACLDMDKALSHTAGDDYVSKASVKPIVEALKKLHNYEYMSVDEASDAVEQAMEQAKLLGLV